MEKKKTNSRAKEIRLKIIRQLYYPFLTETIYSLSKAINVSPQTTKKYVKQLVEEGLIWEMVNTDKEKKRYEYCLETKTFEYFEKYEKKLKLPSFDKRTTKEIIEEQNKKLNRDKTK